MRKFFDLIKILFSKKWDEQDVSKAADVIELVDKIKNVVNSQVFDTIVDVIPGGIDDAILRTTRAALERLFQKAIAANPEAVMEDLDDATKSSSAYKYILQTIRNIPIGDFRNACYARLASEILMAERNLGRGAANVLIEAKYAEMKGNQIIG